MNLYEKAKKDNQRILNKGFVVEGELNNNKVPGASKQSIKVHFNDVHYALNPETGLPIIGRKVSVSMHIEDITIAKPTDNFENWIITFTNNLGQSVKGIFVKPLYNRTLGMLTTTLRIQE